eukprot:COSAG01_NODE_8569_length_2737_cov_3.180819_2_plen_75_part_00
MACDTTTKASHVRGYIHVRVRNYFPNRAYLNDKVQLLTQWFQPLLEFCRLLLVHSGSQLAHVHFLLWSWQVYST